VIQLVASCLDWAEHNHRKAAAKCHLRLSLRSLLPGFVVVGSAHASEQSQARKLCAGLLRGEIVLFDRGYHHLAHFWELSERGVYFVTRPLPAVGLKVVRRLAPSRDPRVLHDELVVTTGRSVAGDYPSPLRRVTARVVVDGEERIMEFLTNNLTWSAGSVAELYRCRWQIEAFFKQVKQTLQLADFLGHNANAVQWQVWIALLVYVLLRFQAWSSQWLHSFTRLFTLLRATLWQQRDLAQMLRRYGTAHGHYAWLPGHAQGWLPGLAP